VTENPGGGRCPRCGVEVAAGLGFCGSCGEGLPFAASLGGVPGHGYAIGERVEDCEIIGPPQVGVLGERYLARDCIDGREVELRVLRPALGVRPASVQRFRAMLESLGALKINGLRDLQRFSEEAGCFRLVLDTADGELLSERLSGPSGARRTPDRRMTREVLAAVCEALEHVHEISAHGALWPDAIRIALGRDGEVDRLWLDLPGESWLLPDPRTCARHTPGTAAYLAPELLEGDPPAPPADVYAVGVLAYELLTGRPPRGLAPLPSRAVGRLSPSVDRVITRALFERPGGRYASIADLGQDLDAALREPPPPPVEEETRVPLAERSQTIAASASTVADLLPAAPPPRRRRSAWSVFAVLLLLLGLGAGGAAYAWQKIAARPAVAPNGPAQLTIRTVPQGSSVNVDGEDLGYAPMTLSEVSPGVTHFLRLSARGHQLKVVEVKLTPGQRRVIVVRLDPEASVR